MSITKQQILDAISEMSIMDISELVNMMEKKFGVFATQAPNSQKNLEKTPEEKTEFNVILNSIGTNKIPVIKAIRSITSLGLKEAKDMVESAPVTIKESINKEESEKIKKLLEDVGASVEIK